MQVGRLRIDHVDKPKFAKDPFGEIERIDPGVGGQAPAVEFHQHDRGMAGDCPRRSLENCFFKPLDIDLDEVDSCQRLLFDESVDGDCRNRGGVWIRGDVAVREVLEQLHGSRCIADGSIPRTNVGQAIVLDVAHERRIDRFPRFERVHHSLRQALAQHRSSHADVGSHIQRDRIRFGQQAATQRRAGRHGPEPGATPRRRYRGSCPSPVSSRARPSATTKSRPEGQRPWNTRGGRDTIAVQSSRRHSAGSESS